MFIAAALSCGGNSATSSDTGPACNCTPTKPESNDYRHAAKHVDLPAVTPQEITVNEILSWPQGPAPSSTAPRSGRELQLFHIATAYLQQVYVNPGDCDIHFEISQIPDKNAPRMIVETPSDPSYCTARSQIQSQLATHGITLPAGGDVNPALACEATGLAFQDFEHTRGTKLVKTVWELHPAIVTLLQ
jgi:hypothetical protein